MKNLKEYVRLIFAAVICLFLGMKKNGAGKNPVVGFAGAGNLSGGETWGMSGCREGAGGTLRMGSEERLRGSNTVKDEKRERPKIQKGFFWLKGPGDRPRPDKIAFCTDGTHKKIRS